MNRKAKQDIFVCIAIYLFILFFFVVSLKLVNGAETMPRLILILAAICNTVLLVRTVSNLKKDPGGEGYATFSEIKAPMLMFAGVVAYCVLFRLTNYFIATAVMLFVFMMIEKVRPIWKIIVIDIVYLIFIYVLFVMVLKVPMIH